MQVTIRRKDKSQQTHKNVKDITFFPHGDPNVNVFISLEYDTRNIHRYWSIQKQYANDIEAVTVEQPAVREMVAALRQIEQAARNGDCYCELGEGSHAIECPVAIADMASKALANLEAK